MYSASSNKSIARCKSCSHTFSLGYHYRQIRLLHAHSPPSKPAHTTLLPSPNPSLRRAPSHSTRPDSPSPAHGQRPRPCADIPSRPWDFFPRPSPFHDTDTSQTSHRYFPRPLPPSRIAPPSPDSTCVPNPSYKSTSPTHISLALCSPIALPNRQPLDKPPVFPLSLRYPGSKTTGTRQIEFGHPEHGQRSPA